MRYDSAAMCHTHLIRISAVTPIVALVVIASARSLLAASGTVELDDANFPNDFPSAPLHEDAVTPSVTVPSMVTASLSPATPEPSPFERPWNLFVPLAPTAFVLDSRHFQFSMEMLPEQRLMGDTSPFFTARYGLWSSLTLGLGASALARAPTFFFNPRWNFLNSGADSYSLSPWVSVRGGVDDAYESSNTTLPLGLAVTFSHVIDDYRRLHFTVSGFYASENSTQYLQAWNYTIAHLQPVTQRYGSNSYSARISASHEWRIGKVSGITASIAPEVNITDNISSGYWHFSSYQEQAVYLKFGVGYQATWKNIGFHVALEGGPNYKGNYSKISAFDMTSGSLGFEYLL